MKFNRQIFETPNKAVKFGIAKDYFECFPNNNDDAIHLDVLVVKGIEDYKNNINPYLEYVKIYFNNKFNNKHIF